MIRRPVDVFVQEIKPQDDKVHGAPFRVRVINKRASAHISMKMAQIARRQVIDDLVAKRLFEANDGIPCWSLRSTQGDRLGLQRVIDRQDEGFS